MNFIDANSANRITNEFNIATSLISHFKLNNRLIHSHVTLGGTKLVCMGTYVMYDSHSFCLYLLNEFAEIHYNFPECELNRVHRHEFIKMI